MTVTFVTSFFDLHTKNYKVERTHNDYLNMFKQIPISEIPFLVIFTNKESIDFLSGLDEYFKINNLKYKIICVDLNDFITIESFKNCLKPSYSRFTDEYLQLSQCKIEFIKTAVDLNHFNTELFAWIDFGLFHVSRATKLEMNQIVNSITKKLKLCITDVFDKVDLHDKKSFYSKFKCYAAGGFITGSKDNFIHFYNLYKNEFEIMRSFDIMGLEEQIFSILVEEKSSIFDLYFGGYCGLLKNYNFYTRHDNFIIPFLCKCADAQQYKKGAQFSLSLIKSLKTNKFIITNNKFMMDFLYRAQICAVYTSYNLPNNENLAVALANVMHSLSIYKYHFNHLMGSNWEKNIEYTKYNNKMTLEDFYSQYLYDILYSIF